MSPFYIATQGATVSKVSERLNITLKQELLREIPLLKISELVVFGNVNITPPAFKTMAKHGIGVIYLTRHGDYQFRLQPEISKNIPLRMAQFKTFFDEAQRVRIARQCVGGKLFNLRTMLSRKGDDQSKKELKQAVKRIKTMETKGIRVDALDELRGYEGQGSAAYFEVFQRLIKVEGFSFTTRVRRPPTDPVNALLSFGYTLLLKDMITAVTIAGFDPYLGYLHSPEYGRPALALDLMEEFRPIIVDAMVLTCLNKQILTPEEFYKTEDGAIRLTKDGCRKFVAQYDARRATELTHPVVSQKMTYQRAFEQQARLLAKTLMGEVKNYQPLLM